MLFLHADDVGGTETGTVQILEAWENGYLDGFSVFANGDATETVRSRLSRCPKSRARISAHLNLSEGPSLASPDRVPLLVDQRGELRHDFGSLLASWLGGSTPYRRMLVEQVEAEWRAQVVRITELIAPRRLTGVDGHIHVHMLPFLFPIAAGLASEFGVEMIRIVREPIHFAGGLQSTLSTSYARGLVKHLVLRAYARTATRIALERGLQFPSRVVGVLFSGSMTKATALAGISASQRTGVDTVEVIFHIGRAVNDERSRWSNRTAIAVFNCSPERDQERAELAALHESLVDRGLRSIQGVSSASVPID